MCPFLSWIVTDSVIKEGRKKPHLPLLKCFILQSVLLDGEWWGIPVILVTKEAGTGELGV